MSIVVTRHAKKRWYERFIGEGEIDGNQIEADILNNFSETKRIEKQGKISIYRSFDKYFVVKDNSILTVYSKIGNSPEISVYKDVLNDILQRFPNGFWIEDVGGDVFLGARDCTQYMFEKVLKWSKMDIIQKAMPDTFVDGKLRGMVDTLFEGSWQMAVYNAYPDIKPYMLKKTGCFRLFWESNGRERAKEFGEWLIGELANDGYKFSGRGVLSLRWNPIIIKYRIRPMIRIVFNNDLADFFNTLFDSGVDADDVARYESMVERVKFERIHI